MNNLLLDEHPLVIIPSLAEKVGLNEAIILQQLHYWLNKSDKVRDGRRWIYNTYKDWKEQFPFWSEVTIRRTITKLEKQGLIISGNFNKASIDKTKWYSLDYEELKHVISPCDQNDQSKRSKCSIEEIKMSAPIPETTTENSTEKVVVNPFEFYQQNFGVLKPFVAQEVGYWIDDIGEELVVEAMKIALKQQKQWSYAEGILKRWHDKGLKDVTDVKAFEVGFKKKKDKDKPQIEETYQEEDKNLGFNLLEA